VCGMNEKKKKKIVESVLVQVKVKVKVSNCGWQKETHI